MVAAGWFIGRPFVKRFALCYRSVVCLSCPVLSCLSVTFVHCGQTVGRIKMKLGMQADLGPCDFVLDGDPAPPKKGAEPPLQFSVHFYCGQNGWMHQDATGYRGRSQPTGLCVRWGPRSPPKRPPKFSAHVYCGQTDGWMKLILGTEVGLSPGDCVNGEPAPTSPKRGQRPLLNLGSISIVAKRLHASRCHLV